jgi:secretion/DNA translocation related TadE-like protein
MMRPVGDEPARDCGSATVWALAIAVAVLALTWAALLVVGAIAARHRVESAADLAALAGAAALRDGGDGCGAATAIAVANGAAMTSCEAGSDASITVTVTLPLPPTLIRWAGHQVDATARAGS